MRTTSFSGPLTIDFEAFAKTLEASAVANKAMLTWLRALDRLTCEHQLSSGTIDEALAMAWLAPCASRGANTRLARFHLLRRFCRFLAGRRPGTFVPGESLRPRGRPPAPPHIYTPEEIRLLLDEALSLRDWKKARFQPIRSKTMYTIILLLATSGLRISEALHLTMRDINLVEGVLSIHQSKFRKSRLVPLSQGTLDVLCRYHDLRISVAPADLDDAFFISGRGKAYGTSYVQTMFRSITIQTGLRGPKGRGPRLHDLRHTFAVTRLLEWYRDGGDVMARLPLLSTYLGHACVSDTEVYLRITTALLEEASNRYHVYAQDTLPEGGVS